MDIEIDPVFDHFKERVVKVITRPSFVALCVLLLGSALYSFYSLITDGSGIHIIFILLEAFIAALMLFWTLFRSIGSDHVVVWLRRFHELEKSRFPMPNHLSLIGAGKFQVTTIQDTRFKTSFLTGATKSVLTIAVVQILLALPCFVLSMYLVGQIFGLNHSAEKDISFFQLTTTIVLAPFLAALISGPIFFFLSRKRGLEVLKSKRDVKKIVKWTNRIQDGIGHWNAGLKIFKCADEFWGSAVNTLLERCDAVIIDVSEINDNIGWELLQCVLKI